MFYNVYCKKENGRQTMKTSYFANPDILEKDLKLVSIARKIPTWFTKDILIYQPLCPSWKLVMDYKSKKINEQEYTERYYYEILSNLDAARTYQELGEDAILLCYEKAGQFCHRHLVGKWLMDELHIIVMER